jgi:hypothetical protein
MHVVCALHRQPAISLHAAQPRADNDTCCVRVTLFLHLLCSLQTKRGARHQVDFDWSAARNA